MATYARAIRRAAIRGEGVLRSVALVRLSKKREEGSPGWFVLYRCVERLGFPDGRYFAIIRHLNAQTTEEALRRFWPYERNGQGREFPPFGSSRWEKASGWLYSVAVSDKFAAGSCVKVGKAAGDRRQYYKEEPPLRESPSPQRKTLLQRLEQKRNELTDRLSELENPKCDSRWTFRSIREEHVRLSALLADVEKQIHLLQEKGAATTFQEIIDRASQMQAAQ